jgi:hypothetical protein
MWAKYMPQDSVMGQNGARMVNQVWEAAASFYNANMRNLAGPWDRNYGYDMNKYVAILSLYVWSLVGRDHVFPNEDMYLLAHADDGEIVPVISVLSEFHATLVSNDTLSKLATFPGEHTVHRSAFAPPADIVPRNITTWLSANLTVGAMSYNQTQLGGARLDVTSFMPAVVQWLRADASVGWFNLYPTEMGMQASVAPGAVNLTYPQGNASSVFTFVVSTNPLGGKRNILTPADVQDLAIEVSGSVNPTPLAGFCGLVGGVCKVVQ